MNLNISSKVFTIILSATITVFVILNYFIFGGEQEYTEKESSESYDIMNFYSDMRTYPDEKNSNGKYYEAFLNSALKPLENDNYSTWTNIGPANVGGRTLCTAINPNDTSVLWLGSASGGLWKTTTGGIGTNVFTNIPTGFPVLAVSCIVIDSGNTNIMYIGTGETYGYQQSLNGLSIRTTRGSYGVGILKTTNAGLNWIKSLDWTYDQNRGIWDIIYNPLNHDILYAATTEGVYKSNDAGGSWVQVFNGQMVTDLEINRTDTSTVFAGTGNLSSPSPGLYRTTNSGTNWTKLTSGLPVTSNDGRITVASYYGNPSILFAVFGNRLSTVGVYRSSDNGNNWTQTSGTTPDFLSDQGWYANGIKINDTDSSKILFGGVNFYKSTNFGSDLTLKSSTNTSATNYIHVDHHDIISNPKDPNKVYIATDGGLYRSNNFGETFFRCQSGYVTTQFYANISNSATDSTLILGGVQDNGVVRFGGSTSWYRSSSGDGMMCYINPLNNNSVIACNQYLEISRSYSKGDQGTWTVVYSSNSTNSNFTAPLASCPSDTSVFYGGTKLIVKSTNGGLNWFNASSDLDGNKILSIAVSHTSTDTLYAATVPTGTPMGFFKSTDGGTNWTNISAGLPNRYPTDIEINPSNSLDVFAVFGGFGTSHIFRSTNGGSNWNDINNGLPDIPFHTIAIDPQFTTNIYAGSDLGIYISTNTGNNWFTFNEGMPEAVMVFDLAISPSNRSLRAATHGRGVYERNLINNNALPVEMLEMSLSSISNRVTLRWKTSYERNNKEFIIERSINGGQFTAAGKISGRGNTNIPSEYKFEEDVDTPGKYRYRIKQTDYNGNYEYYNFQNSVQVGNPQSFQMMQNFPNPFNTKTIISFNISETSFVTLKIFDVTGREIKTLINETIRPGYYKSEFDGSELASGIYLCNINSGNYAKTIKMFLVK